MRWKGKMKTLQCESESAIRTLWFARKGVIVLSLAFGFAAFVSRYYLELRFYDAKALDQFNVFFDADPNLRLIAFSASSFEGMVSHPNGQLFIGIPIKIVSKTLHILRISRRNEREIGRSLALLVSPLFSSLKAASLIIFFSFLGFSLFRVFLIGFLGLVSFSEIIFGSVPEYYVISGFLLVFLNMLLLDRLQRKDKFGWAVWTVLGILITGITSTNAMFFLLFLFLGSYFTSKNIWHAGKGTLRIGILVSLATGMCFCGWHLVCGKSIRMEALDSGRWAKRYIHKSPGEPIGRIAEAVVSVIAPPALYTKGNTALSEGDRYQFMFTLDHRDRINATILLLLTLILLLAGTTRGLLHAADFRILTAVSLFVVVVNLVFHSYWGSEYFLYSQHSLISIIILLSGNLLFRGKAAIFATGIFMFYVAGVFINNARLIQEIIGYFSAI
jgi:hypothetical protein